MLPGILEHSTARRSHVSSIFENKHNNGRPCYLVLWNTYKDKNWVVMLSGILERKYNESGGDGGRACHVIFKSTDKHNKG